MSKSTDEFLDTFFDQNENEGADVLISFVNGVSKVQFNEAAKAALKQRFLEERVAELTYLLEDFGVEDNTEPIKRRIQIIKDNR